LYFQNQSLNPVLRPTPAWAELLLLLATYSRDSSLDVRIILRNIGPIRKKLESLQAVGFDMTKVRSQVGCHTKGILIDSERLLLGSHNWTDEGVQVNRDASVLIRRPEIARYYERVFLHDWDRLARPTIREELMPIPVLSDDESAAPMDRRTFRRVPWSAWEEEE
jgi:phosphatidylserine/phosphatidylglycerophosphate/cardiolipin synthase-like enzyme